MNSEDEPPAEEASDVSVDIHICGRCKTLFNSVEEFIQHKQGACSTPHSKVKSTAAETGNQEMSIREKLQCSITASDEVMHAGIPTDVVLDNSLIHQASEESGIVEIETAPEALIHSDNLTQLNVLSQNMQQESVHSVLYASQNQQQSVSPALYHTTQIMQPLQPGPYTTTQPVIRYGGTQGINNNPRMKSLLHPPTNASQNVVVHANTRVLSEMTHSTECDVISLTDGSTQQILLTHQLNQQSGSTGNHQHPVTARLLQQPAITQLSSSHESSNMPTSHVQSGTHVASIVTPTQVQAGVPPTQVFLSTFRNQPMQVSGHALQTVYQTQTAEQGGSVEARHVTADITQSSNQNQQLLGAALQQITKPVQISLLSSSVVDESNTGVSQVDCIPVNFQTPGGQLSISVPATAGQSIILPGDEQSLKSLLQNAGSFINISHPPYTPTLNVQLRPGIASDTSPNRILVKSRQMPVKKYKCTFEKCPFITAYQKDLDRHTRTHTGERPFKCNVCGKAFTRNDKLKVHQRGHTGTRPYKCEICNYSATDNSSLKKHIRIHTNERPFKCQICPYASRNSSQLIVHLRSHTGDSPFQCPLCDAKFKINSDLKRHLRIHTGEKPYRCELCDYRCSIKGNLKSHYRIKHSAENLIKCNECEFLTASRKLLKEHVKAHNTEHSVFCSICNFQCLTKSGLQNHMRTHETVRPFQCDFCEYTSKQNGNVRSHMRSKHPENLYSKSRRALRRVEKATPGREQEQINITIRSSCRKAYKCETCSASFVRADSLRSHMRQHRDVQNSGLAAIQLSSTFSNTCSQTAVSSLNQVGQAVNIVNPIGSGLPPTSGDLSHCGPSIPTSVPASLTSRAVNNAADIIISAAEAIQASENQSWGTTDLDLRQRPPDLGLCQRPPAMQPEQGMNPASRVLRSEPTNASPLQVVRTGQDMNASSQAMGGEQGVNPSSQRLEQVENSLKTVVSTVSVILKSNSGIIASQVPRFQHETVHQSNVLGYSSMPSHNGQQILSLPIGDSSSTTLSTSQMLNSSGLQVITGQFVECGNSSAVGPISAVSGNQEQIIDAPRFKLAAADNGAVNLQVLHGSHFQVPQANINVLKLPVFLHGSSISSVPVVSGIDSLAGSGHPSMIVQVVGSGTMTTPSVVPIQELKTGTIYQDSKQDMSMLSREKNLVARGNPPSDQL